MTTPMISINPIGIIHSDYKEKFAVPRQSGLNNVESILEINLNNFQNDHFRGLEKFSHIWVIFHFHLINDSKANEQVLVRPPRLGGTIKKGIYATRSPHRPNRIGLSLVKIQSIQENKIYITGGDFVNGTPIIDLKPYIPEDVASEAFFGWTQHAEPILELKVHFRPHLKISQKDREDIQELLKNDPRPAHQKHDDRKSTYKVFIKNFNVNFTVEDESILWVEEINDTNS